MASNKGMASAVAKTRGAYFSIRTNLFGSFFGLFYDFFVFYNVDFFTECFSLC